jgi:hypothetical protein
MVREFLNTLSGKEGLFLATLTGRGHVALQSMAILNLGGDRPLSARPHGNKHRDHRWARRSDRRLPGRVVRESQRQLSGSWSRTGPNHRIRAAASVLMGAVRAASPFRICAENAEILRSQRNVCACGAA